MIKASSARTRIFRGLQPISSFSLRKGDFDNAKEEYYGWARILVFVLQLTFPEDSVSMLQSRVMRNQWPECLRTSLWAYVFIWDHFRFYVKPLAEIDSPIFVHEAPTLAKSARKLQSPVAPAFTPSVINSKEYFGD